MITGKYKELYNELNKEMPKERLSMIHKHPCIWTDASYTDFNPKLIVKVSSEKDLQLGKKGK